MLLDGLGVQTAGAVRELRDVVSRRICLHPAAPVGCTKIGRAHTIQRATALKRIARDGHLYTTPLDLPHAMASGPKAMRLVGIEKASTFAGFCARHDDELFYLAAALRPGDSGAALIDPSGAVVGVAFAVVLWLISKPITGLMGGVK